MIVSPGRASTLSCSHTTPAAEHSDFYSQPLHNGTGSVPKATQPFWANEHGLQDTLEVTDEAKMPEDNSPAEVDEGSLNAYVLNGLKHVLVFLGF